MHAKKLIRYNLGDYLFYRSLGMSMKQLFRHQNSALKIFHNCHRFFCYSGMKQERIIPS
jgi:hypothetical protein